MLILRSAFTLHDINSFSGASTHLVCSFNQNEKLVLAELSTWKMNEALIFPCQLKNLKRKNMTCISVFQAYNTDNSISKNSKFQHAHVFFRVRKFSSPFLLLLSLQKKFTKIFLCCDKFVEFCMQLFTKLRNVAQLWNLLCFSLTKQAL